MGLISFIKGSDNRKHLKKLEAIAEKIEEYSEQYKELSEEELKGKTAEFRRRLKENFETLDDILPEAFATVREASARVLGMRHFHVQLLGGITLHQGRIAEMRTGEGKTLVSTLPAYLNALAGEGVHIVTVNDYLAKRDAEWMGKVHRYLGLTVGVVLSGMRPEEKIAAYNCDITYATNNELGFDYLRDNMARKKENVMQRKLSYAIIDEVDSILIDEARTPLIISQPAEKSSRMYDDANDFVKSLRRDFDVDETGKEIVILQDGETKINSKFGAKYVKENPEIIDVVKKAIYDHFIVKEDADEDELTQEELDELPERDRLLYRLVRELRYDYTLDEKKKTISLTVQGTRRAEKKYKVDNLTDLENSDLAHYINNALRARKIMRRDKDYIISDNNEVVIVDEFTGRLMPGRRYSDGLHQAIEAKEGVKIQNESKTVATITFQNFFRLYDKLAGMTGTAKTEEDEFKGIYGLDVVEIPPNLPSQRVDESDKLFANIETKTAAIIRDVKECYGRGQPVLVGTTSVEKSEQLARAFDRAGVKAQVLNAKNHEKEAEIVAQAGKFKAVTIATNMAGRGTDILLGGNPEFLAKEKMRKEKFDEELISAATAYFSTEDPKILDARKRYSELYSEFKKQTDAEKEKVKEVGGLRIIGTERHESRRIDNQLRGRAGRQGDIGSSVFYLSVEDDLLRLFGGDKLQRGYNMLAPKDEFNPDIAEGVSMKMFDRGVANAQAKLEGRNYSSRRQVIEYDNVMNTQRTIIYEERNKILRGENVHDEIVEMMRARVKKTVEEYTDPKTDWNEWQYAELNTEIRKKLLPGDTDFMTEDRMEKFTIEELEDQLLAAMQEAIEQKVKIRQENLENLTLALKEQLGDRASNINVKEDEDYAEFERSILLEVVDRQWTEHIDAMDALRSGIGLKAYGQQDPIIAYKQDGFGLFDEMVDRIQEYTVGILMNNEIKKTDYRDRDLKNLIFGRGRSLLKAPRIRKSTELKGKDRNAKCPCGSGKKYKDCCWDKDHQG